MLPAALRILAGAAAVTLALVHVAAFAEPRAEETIARVKPSVVLIGTFQQTRNPRFAFLGTGFAVADGSIVATNSHVVPLSTDATKREEIAIVLPARTADGAEPVTTMRIARTIARDTVHDLALLRVDGEPLPALRLGDSTAVREGRTVFFTGFPIGTVLGAIPATHRAMVAAVTPIAIPQRRDAELPAATVRRLQSGPFAVFQLDGTAYPGNSGSPVYDAASGEVVGIVNMVLVKGTRESLLSQPSGIAYAIPAEHLRALLASVR